MAEQENKRRTRQSNKAPIDGTYARLQPKQLK